MSSERQLPRLGKIRLGEKRMSQGGKEYPAALDYFKFDDDALDAWPQIAEAYADADGVIEPKALDVVLPADEQRIVFPQALKLYGRERGLKCKGNGRRAIQFTCAKCGKVDCRCKDADRVQNEIACPCDNKDCRPIGSLMAVLPRVTWAGVWQIDTGSRISIRALNSGIDFVRHLVGRVAMVPLTLRLVPQIVHPNAVKKTIYVMQLSFAGDLREIRRLRRGGVGEARMIEAPHDEGDELPAVVGEEPEEGNGNGTANHKGTKDTKDTKDTKNGLDSNGTEKATATDEPIGLMEANQFRFYTQELALNKVDWETMLRPLGVARIGELTHRQASALRKTFETRLRKEVTEEIVRLVAGHAAAALEFERVTRDAGIQKHADWDAAPTATLTEVRTGLRHIVDDPLESTE